MSGKRSIGDFFRSSTDRAPRKRARTSPPGLSAIASQSLQDEAAIDPELARAIELSLKESQPLKSPSRYHDQTYDAPNVDEGPEAVDQEPSHRSSHSTYPHPIANFPSYLTLFLESLPTKAPTALSPPPSSPPAHHEDLDSLFYHPLIARADSIALFKFLRTELPFYRVAYDINRFGKSTRINTPRYTSVFGVDDTCCFVLDPPRSGPILQTSDMTKRLVSSKNPDVSVSPHSYQRPPRPIPDCLQALKDAVERVTSERYNFVLVNYYADGNDSISYHSDDERFLGDRPAIASLSLGAVRDFCMKHKDEPSVNHDRPEEKKTKPGERVIKIPLESGDLVLMRGLTQSRWLHAVPKRKGDMGKTGRINITFRRALVREGTNNYYRYNVGDGGVWRWNEREKAMMEWNGHAPVLK